MVEEDGRRATKKRIRKKGRRKLKRPFMYGRLSVSGRILHNALLIRAAERRRSSFVDVKSAIASSLRFVTSRTHNLCALCW